MKRPCIRGPITPFRGQQRSPWLLTTYVRPGMILQVSSPFECFSWMKRAIWKKVSLLSNVQTFDESEPEPNNAEAGDGHHASNWGDKPPPRMMMMMMMMMMMTVMIQIGVIGGPVANLHDNGTRGPVMKMIFCIQNEDVSLRHVSLPEDQLLQSDLLITQMGVT